MLSFTTVCILVVIALLGRWLLKKPSKLPPGPGVREIFEMFFIKWPDPQVLTIEWPRRHGDIMCLKLFGGDPAIFLNSYELIRELFVVQAENFSDRPSNMWLINQLQKGRGIIFNATEWKVTRRFSLHTMRDFGLGKQSLEERIQFEARALVEVFKSKTNEAFDPGEDLNRSVANIICSMTFGKRYTYDDKEFREVLKNLREYFTCRFNQSPLNNMPWLRYLGFLFKSFTLEHYMQKVAPLREFIQSEIIKHKETYDPDNMRDLVDLYIQAEKKDFQDMKGMDKEQLLQTILDLFMAGTDTTYNTLGWLLLYLINNVEVQKKCQEEIKRELDGNALPLYRDRARFPYIMATIQEVIRMNTVAPGSLPHTALKDTKIRDYVIPQGSVIIGFSMGIMYDPKIWGEDCDKFRPERWLDESGELRNIPEFIPFMIGKRSCIGEQLARNELFLFTVALLQNFTFQAEDPLHPPPVHGEMLFVYRPDAFKIVPVPVE